MRQRLERRTRLLRECQDGGVDDLDPDELDDFIAAWDEVDREAVELLCAALAAHRGLPPSAVELSAAAARLREEIDADLFPLGWVHRAAALERETLPEDDAELVLRCAAATISPREETGLGIEEEAALLSLEHADWLAAVIVTVREGAGCEASGEALADAVNHCPEVPLEADLDLDEELHLEAAFSTAVLAWLALGLVDHDERLTPLGAWALPRALAQAWGGEFDPRTTG
jgi:hypothetical protein